MADMETKNPSTQQKSAYRTQTLSMPSLTQLTTINFHSTEYVFQKEPNFATDASEHGGDEPYTTHDSSKKDIKYEGQLTPTLLYQARMEYKIRCHREVDPSLSDDVHDVV